MLTMEITRLIERCRQGDEEALGELYKAYAQRMRGVCRRYIRDEQAVEDVLHDAFVIIFTSFDRLRDVGRAEAWMTAITRNVASRYRDRMVALPMMSLDAVAEADLAVAGDEDRDVRGIPLSEVMSMIDRLPEGYGRVFRLSVFEGMSHKEIAAALGIEPHSSSSQLARAKRMLREMMQRYGVAVILPAVVLLTFFLLRRSETDVSKDDAAARAKWNVSPTDRPQKPTIARRLREKDGTSGMQPAYRASAIAADTLQMEIAQIVDSVPDMAAQDQTIADTLSNDTARTLRSTQLPRRDMAELMPEKPAVSTCRQQTWAVDVASSIGTFGEQDYYRPYGFTETPTLAPSGELPSPVTFENWSDYAAFLADNPDDGSSYSRSVIMNIALNNAGDAQGTGTDKIVRKSHHYMPVNFSFALKYQLNNRFGLETGLSYSRLKSDFEMGSNGNTINEQQTIHYLGIPVKGIYNIYYRKAWSLYGSLGVTTEIPLYSPLNTSYYLHGMLEATDKSTIHAPWQWLVGTGLGLQYNFTPNIGLFAEPSLQYYIPTGAQIETYRSEHPFTFSLPIGIRFTW